ncbi:MAG: hypothetical protein D6808_02520 [Candidatus Dadabacteria bacterium]|nr:MAG: hypothetical protein D6808_02520 [Candidatus Dadabacteria bacterium]
MQLQKKKYGETLDAVYLFGDSLPHKELQDLLGRRVEKVEVRELVKDSNEPNSLASLAAFYGQDAPARLLTNFRTGDLAYRPRFRELLNGLRSLALYAIMVFVAVGIYLGTSYYITQSRINSLKQEIHKEITKYIPAITPIDGEELNQIRKEIAKVQKQLEKLGSLSQLSSLDIFLELSKDLPKGNDFEIYKLEIKGNKITVKGNADRYSTIDRIEDALKKKRNIYCKVDVRTDNIITRTNQFELILEIC